MAPLADPKKAAKGVLSLGKTTGRSDKYMSYAFATEELKNICRENAKPELLAEKMDRMRNQFPIETCGKLLRQQYLTKLAARIDTLMLEPEPDDPQ